MSPTHTVVSLSHLLATTCFTTRKTFKVQNLGLFWCTLFQRTKRLNFFSLCEPQTLYQPFNWKPIQTTHEQEQEVLTC